MAKYVRETDRNRTLHLVKLEQSTGGNTEMFLDATRRIKEAGRADKKAGYTHNGPNTGQEVMKAIEYAEYVADYATPETLHHFNTRDYVFFTESSRNSPRTNSRDRLG